MMIPASYLFRDLGVGRGPLPRARQRRRSRFGESVMAGAVGGFVTWLLVSLTAGT
ncbi:MAG: hypothetical protein AAFX81_08910 [Pseudomonadota bacterium]